MPNNRGGGWGEKTEYPDAALRDFKGLSTVLLKWTLEMIPEKNNLGKLQRGKGHDRLQLI